jgi:hypothetical protein
MLPESASECERARQLDPGVKMITSTLNAYLYLGQYDKFLESLPKTDDAALIAFYRGFGEYYNKDLDQAETNFDHAFELDRTLLQAETGQAFSFEFSTRMPGPLQFCMRWKLRSTNEVWPIPKPFTRSLRRMRRSETSPRSMPIVISTLACLRGTSAMRCCAGFFMGTVSPIRKTCSSHLSGCTFAAGPKIRSDG